jgi:PEP-CTERM motif
LLGTSIVDFGSGSGSLLTFADIASWTGVLKIYNYSGAAWTSGSDQVIFTANTALPDLLTGVEFYSDEGFTRLSTGGAFLSGGTTGQLVPVPEPTACLGVIGLLAASGWRQRRIKVRR